MNKRQFLITTRFTKKKIQTNCIKALVGTFKVTWGSI